MLKRYRHLRLIYKQIKPKKLRLFILHIFLFISHGTAHVYSSTPTHPN